MPLTFLNWLLALTPVAVVLLLMLRFRWGGARAGAAGWFSALILARLAFGAGWELLAYTQVKAVLLTLDVLYIIWTALLLYHVANEAGAVATIGQALPSLTGDRTLQGLLLGWVFASFLQGMGGFGVPVAVSAPLLVGLGYSPVQAVLMACIGHGWAVNFGSMATSFQTLMAVTGLPGEVLAPDAALLLGFSALSCGAVVAFIGDGWGGLRRTLPAILIIGSVMGGAQYLLVTHGFWTLGATLAALAGLAAGLAVCRLPRYRPSAPVASAVPPKGRIVMALSGYAVLVALAFAFNLIPALNRLVDSVQLDLYFPELTTALGVRTPAGTGRSINLFGHPGAVLLYASVAAFLLYRRAGYYPSAALRRILDRTAHGAVGSSLGVAAMVGMAVMMSHSGMTGLLAQGLSRVFSGSLYPLAAPFIGALGAFITGSNNNSNVLFAVLQMRTAELLRLSVPLILGAQTAGGSLGSIMAPAKVIVGCSTVGLGEDESAVMKPILGYGLLPVLLVALLAVLLARSMGGA